MGLVIKKRADNGKQLSIMVLFLKKEKSIMLFRY